MDKEVNLDKIVNLALRRGFIFPGSEIYGGLANSWDYGPLGVLLKNNIQAKWWRHFVIGRREMVGIDAAVLMNPRVWEVSGHLASFSDPLVEDAVTHKRYRADHLLEEVLGEAMDGKTIEELAKLIKDNKIKSPEGHELIAPKRFNLLFETGLGSTEEDKAKVYLRGELAQAMFVDFKRVRETQRLNVPFGIAAVGKVFRNEITPGNFTFRTLEFDLMEFEYFVKEDKWEYWFDFWQGEMQRWVRDDIGLIEDNLRWREHAKEELSHYSRRTADLEYRTPFGWKEMFGLAYRYDFDLKNHGENSGEDLQVLDAASGKKFYPHVIEPTFGLTRLTLMLMLDAYHEEEVKGETRVVLKLKPDLAPFQVAVLPLSKKEELIRVAEPIADELSREYSCDFDVTQSIGKRYRRQDEIGTPFCVTVDFDSLKDGMVTIRDRDSMAQERVGIEKVGEVLTGKLSKQFKMIEF